MYVVGGIPPEKDSRNSVMGAVDSGRYVIADLEHEDRWLSIERTAAVDLDEIR